MLYKTFKKAAPFAEPLLLLIILLCIEASNLGIVAEILNFCYIIVLEEFALVVEAF